MNNMKRSINARVMCATVTAAVLLLSILMPCAGAAAIKETRGIEVDYQNLTIQINGKAILSKDAAGNTIFPFVYNDRTYLPVRALANALGCGVTWDETNKSVAIVSSGGPGPLYGTPSKKNYAEFITVEYDDITVTLDGKALLITNEPFLYNDSVYLPVREISDALKCIVAYNDATNIISISGGHLNTASAPAPQDVPSQQSVPDTAAPARSPAPAVNANPKSPAALVAQGSFSQDDLSFVISGKSVKLDQNISIIIELLGSPKEYDEVESCAYDGLDKFYVYDGLEVSTLPIDGDLICALDVFVDNIKTDKGITVGDNIARIEAVYGNDYTLENGVMIYWAGAKNNPKTPQLYFMLDKNNTVGSFGMYNGKSAG